MASVRTRESRRLTPERTPQRDGAAARGDGVPLSHEVRAPMERAFSHSFANVRVHADAASDALAQAHGARAMAVGSDIFFRGDAWSPNEARGAELLAHELAHVVQVDRSAPAGESPAETSDSLGSWRSKTTDRSEGAEVEARAAAQSVMSGAAPVITTAPSAAVARDDDDPPGPSFSLLPPKFNYGFGAGGGNANLSLGAGGLGADYSRGLFHGEAALGLGGSASLNLGLGAPLLPWTGDVNRDLGGAAGGVNSLMNGGGLSTSTMGALSGFSALGDIYDAGKPSKSNWGVGLQLSHSDEENRAMLGARFNF